MSNQTSTEESVQALSGCLYAIGVILIAPFGAVWNGFVLLKIYNWFLVYIPGAPRLDIANMIGVSLIAGLLLSSIVYAIEDCKREIREDGRKVKTDFGALFWKAVVLMFVSPLIMLCFAWMYWWILVR